MLAHLASEEGKAAVEYILGHKGHVNYDAVPSCVFAFPEIAACGLTEDEAKRRGISYEVSKSMFSSNGKALTMGESDGFVKIIAEKSSRKIIGVHIIGPNASDLIHEGTLAVENGLTVTDVGQTIHAHPTLAETFHEAVLGIDNKAIHTMPKK
jgi:dihydrolipoamide dehydrogenase